MTGQILDADRLKTVRKARKLGRPRLARLAGLTERQVTRLEGAGTAVGLGPDAVLRLSAALQIPAEALTGALPLSEDDLSPASQSTCTSGCCG